MAGTLTVTKQTQTITFGALAAKTYGAADYAPGATASSGLTVTYASSNPAVATIVGGNIHIVGAGTTNITASQAGDLNYEAAADVIQPLTVNKATLTVTASSASKTYAAVNPALTVSYSGFVNTETAANLTTQPTATTTALTGSPAGSYATTASGGVSSNYSFTYVAGTLTINPAALTVTAVNNSKTYGAVNPALTVSYSGFVNGDTAASLTTQPTASTTALTGSPAGTYPITAAGGASGNYSFTYIAGTLTVNPAPLTVTADNKTKVQGSVNPALTVSYSGFVNGDTATSLTTQPTASTTAITSSPVGTYPITASGGVGSNYSFSYVAGTLTVTPAILTVTAHAKTKSYGSADPVLTYTASGFVNGDTIAIMTGSLSRAPGENVSGSPYAILQNTLSAGSNYSISYTGANLTITPVTLTVTGDNKSKLYGDSIPVLTVSYSGFVNGDTASSLTTQPTAATTATPATPVGSYPITASGGASGNYNFSYVNGSLTVTPALLTVIADNKSKTYGVANPVLTVSYSGFTNGDTAASLTTQPTATTSTTISTPVGSYPINASGGVSSNYSLSYVAGTLTVDKAALTVTADNKSKVAGSPNPAFTVTYSGFVNSENETALITQPSATSTANSSSPAGTYPITASGGVSSNYSFTYVDGTLTVTSSTINVTAFSMPATATSLTVPVSTFTATDSVGVAGYLITESPIAPSSGAAGWSAIAPSSFTFSGYGLKTAYAWAKDASGNVSASRAATVNVISPVTYYLNAGSATSIGIDGNTTVTATGQIYTVTPLGSTNQTRGLATEMAPIESVQGVVQAGSGSAWTGTDQEMVRMYTPRYTNANRFIEASVGVYADMYMKVTGTAASAKATLYEYSETTGIVGAAKGTISFTLNPAVTTRQTMSGSFNNTSFTLENGNRLLVIFSMSAVNAAPAYLYGSMATGAPSGYQSITVAETSAVGDIIPPTVDSFTMPTTATALTVAVTTFVASDNTAVTGYLITENATAPLPTDSAWGSTAPTSFTFSGYGAKTAYAWAKDATGNVSSSVAATVTINDVNAPVVTAFAMPATATSLNVPVTSFSATDNLAVTGYLITESFTPPAAGAGGWSATAPISFTFAGYGLRTAYAWAKDAAGNVSAGFSATVMINDNRTTAGTATAFAAGATSISVSAPYSDDANGNNTLLVEYKLSADLAYTTWQTLSHSASPYGTVITGLTSNSSYNVRVTYQDIDGVTGSAQQVLNSTTAVDTTSPTVTAFTMPTSSTTLTVSVTTFTASDNVAVTGYMITESAGAPAAGDARWSGSAPASFTFSGYGVRSAYAWAKDAAGNVSSSASATVTVNDSTAPTITSFSMPATATNLAVNVTAFAATDNVAVTGYMITESATPPAAVAAGWTTNAPTSFTFGGYGAKTAYAWAKDAAGNVSTGMTANVTITDATAPTITAFSMPVTATSLTVAVNSFTASDNVGVTGYMINESATAPLPTDIGWSATAPTSYTFAGSGTRVARAWAKDAAGNVSVSSMAAVTINLSSASTIVVSGITSPRTAGTTGTVTVTVLDTFGNTATGYTGTVHFTSSDSQAALPADYTFTAGDLGVHTFTSVVLKSAGTWSVTVNDLATPSINGTQSGITVTPASTISLSVTGVTTPRTAGTAGSITVTAKDAYGNTATGYTGTVQFASSDAQALLPSNYSFIAGDNGVHTFTNLITLRTAGTQSVTVTDTVTGTITGSQAGIVVNPAAAGTLVVAGVTTPRSAGAVGSVTVTARDAYNNVATGYTGTVHFTSSDATAILPTDYTFVPGDAGLHTFPSITFRTVGTQSVTATDTITATITGAQTGIIVNPATASTLVVSGFASPVTAGTTGSVTVTAKDSFGNTVTGYTGTVRFTSSDAQAALPANYTFVAGDNGVHTFTNLITLKTVGSLSITATDTVSGTVTGTQTGITVTPAAASTLTVTGLTSPRTVGTPGSLTVTARDPFGNTATGYTGTVHFTSNDLQAVLPADYTFTPGDAGVRTFTSVTLRSAGTWSVTAADTLTGTITGSQAGIVVTPETGSAITVTGLSSPRTAGTLGSITVTVKDSFGNTATGYTGTVHFTSSDPQALLPANYTFVAGDAGVHTFTNLVNLRTAGTQSVTVTDTVVGTITGSQLGIQVNPSTAATLSVTGVTTPRTAGTAGSITVTAKDAYGNTATGYTGTVQFASSDAQALLPSNYSFIAGDNGVHTFTNLITLRTAGTQSVTVTDTVTGTITGSQAGIVVNPAAAGTLVVAGVTTPRSAGAVGSVTVTARDAYNNVATGYTGTVHFTSSDATAILPTDYTFVPGDAGLHTFPSITFRTVGTQSVTATDTITATITGAQTGIIVNPATASTLVVSGFASPVTAGTTGSVTVTAKDSFGNTVTGYTGTVRFTSSDAQAALPANYTFVAGDNGVHTFTNLITLKTVGNLSITATDTILGTITGSQTGILVNHAAASTFTVTGVISPRTAGTVGTVSLTAKDAYGNTATGYTGTVHFTSSDPQAVLPADYTFMPGDAGVYLFTTIVLKTSGAQTITATDTVTPSITGLHSSITVNPAAASTLLVNGLASPRTAGAIGSITVTAKDPFGNTATGYNGKVHFTSDDAQAALPADYTFIAGDSGVRTFATISLKSIGTWSVTATDTVNATITGAQSGIVINPASATTLVITGISSPRTAGSVGSITVTARDAFGNTATNYTGIVRFTSSDPQAVLPANYLFVAGDAGVHTFTAGVTLKTSGTQSITATDTVTATITGSQQNIAVTADSASIIAVSGLVTPRTAGTSGSITVTARDQFGNTSTGYTGTVHFISTDLQATLPSDYTFVAGDAGVHTFASLVLKTAGTWSVTATDTVTTSITGTQFNIVVNPASATSLQLSGLATPRIAGVAGNITVTAKDAYGNTATGYLGTVHFTSSDPQALIPANFIFVAGDAGVRTIASGITLRTAGIQSVTATDTVTTTITGSQSGISVTAAAVTNLSVSGVTSPRFVGAPATITVTARDQFGNTATGYLGTVRFSSSDPQAVLPANYTFVTGDAGVHAFASVTFISIGTWSVTATDTVTATITGTQSGIVVNPAPASVLTVTGYVSPNTAGVAGSITVTAKDTFGNTAIGYTGVVRFTSTDSQAVLPSDYTFVAGDAGVHTFPVTLRTAGYQSITVTDTLLPTIKGTRSGIAITAATASNLLVSGIMTPRAAGTAGSITVTAADSFGNKAEGYTGTVRFSSSDAQAFLPSNYTFVATDAGEHTFVYQVILKTVATHFVRATDTVNVLITGVQSGITVTTAPVATLSSRVVAGSNHSVALDTDGHVLTWGKNDVGQLGIGTTTDEVAPVQVTAFANGIDISAGYNHTVALKSDGTVWTWGGNLYGQLGDRTNTNRNTPVQVPGLAGITAVLSGAYHTIALKSDGTVWAWGDNGYGQLGDGSLFNRTMPVQVQGISGVTAIAVGGYHSLFLKSDGTVWGVGFNSSGQLGNNTTSVQTTPVQAAGLSDISSIGGGLLHSIALKKDGSVWAWGGNNHGQLGDNTTLDSSIPKKISTISDVNRITGGDIHSTVLKDDGTVWTWGGNTYGQLGDGTTTDRYVPVQLQGITGLTTLAAGGSHTVALKGDGSIWAWGKNEFGQLGDGSKLYKDHFVPVKGFASTLSVSSGAFHSIALKNDGTVWTWGNNSAGQLGNGTLDNVSLPQQIGLVHPMLTGITAVSAGAYHSLALKGDGTVWAWGANSYGQVGDGTNTNKDKPVQVAGLTGITAIAAGEQFSMALKSDGTVWAFGSNNTGQLGNGTTSNSNVPVMLSGLSGVSKIAAGYLHGLALKSDKTVWSWGSNSYGQLGDGTNNSRVVPAASGLSQVNAIAAGQLHSLAVKSDGTVVAWGSNSSGQLGDGTNTNRNAPVQALSISGASGIAAGENHSLALLSNGSVWSWGGNYKGQLGDGTSISNFAPRQLVDFVNAVSIAAGDTNSAVIKSDGTAWITGNNDSGQLGDGTPYSPGIIPSTVLGNDTMPPSTTASLDTGTYVDAQAIALIADEPARIYFTLDGLTPTTASAQYGDPIPIASSAVLKFFAVDLSGNVEPVNTVTYTIVNSKALSIAINGSGSVNLSTGGSCTTNCSQPIATGTTVNLTPAANADNYFVSWSGCDVVNGQICTVVMTAAKTVTANFAANLPLTLNIVDSGSVSFSTGAVCNGYCIQTFRPGSSVVLTANAGATTVFDSWAGCDSTNGNACTVTMSAARNVTSIFSYLVKSYTDRYNSLQTAYNSAIFNDVLQVRNMNITENLDLNRNVAFKLAGGYDRTFTSVVGQSTLHGTLTVTAGMVIVDNIILH